MKVVVAWQPAAPPRRLVLTQNTTHPQRPWGWGGGGGGVGGAVHCPLLQITII